MRTSLFLLLIFLLGKTTFGQFFDQDSIAQLTEKSILKKVNIDVKIGSSFPVGNYANADLYDEKAGFALPGSVLGLGFNVKPEKVVGLGFNLEMANYRYITEPWDYVARVDTTLSKVNAENWVHVRALGELSVGVATKQLEADFKLLAGVMYVRLPEFSFTQHYASATIINTRVRAGSVAPAIGLGMATRYYFKGFYLKTFANYLLSNTSHNASFSNSINGVYATQVVKTEIRTLSIGIGAGIRF